MSRTFCSIAKAVVPSFTLFIAACTYDRSLGENELLFATTEQMARLTSPIVEDFVRSQTLSKNEQHARQIQQIASRVLEAAHFSPSRWEVSVLDTDRQMIFASPSKVIVVDIGLIDFVENDQELAALVAHSVAHVSYNHFGQRFSRSDPAARQDALATDQSAARVQLLQILGISHITDPAQQPAPFSREHEVIADKAMVRYLVRAGYDPQIGVEIWRRLAKAPLEQKPAFAEIHPVDSVRLNLISEEINLLSEMSRL